MQTHAIKKVIVDAPIIKRIFSVTSNFNCSNNLLSLEFILFRIMYYEIKDEWELLFFFLKCKKGWFCEKRWKIILMKCLTANKGMFSDHFKIYTFHREDGNLTIYSFKCICVCRELMYPGLHMHNWKTSGLYYYLWIDCSVMGYPSFCIYKITAKLFIQIIVHIDTTARGYGDFHFLHIFTRFTYFQIY